MYSRYTATKIGILMNHFHWDGLYILYHYQVQDYQFYDFIHPYYVVERTLAYSNFKLDICRADVLLLVLGTIFQPLGHCTTSHINSLEFFVFYLVLPKGRFARHFFLNSTSPSKLHSDQPQCCRCHESPETTVFLTSFMTAIYIEERDEVDRCGYQTNSNRGK